MNGKAFSRLGLAASPQGGGAVARNRAKRLLAGDASGDMQGSPGFDLVLIPKAEIVKRTQTEVDE